MVNLVNTSNTSYEHVSIVTVEEECAEQQGQISLIMHHQFWSFFLNGPTMFQESNAKSVKCSLTELLAWPLIPFALFAKKEKVWLFII